MERARIRFAPHEALQSTTTKIGKFTDLAVEGSLNLGTDDAAIRAESRGVADADDANGDGGLRLHI
jgi:hypothetical protein